MTTNDKLSRISYVLTARVIDDGAEYAANGDHTSKVTDVKGTPYSMTYTKGSAAAQIYYYITNLQGDVMYLVNANGTKAATYSYDPYGKVTSATGTMAEINPLRYRGYCTDSETGFYYLQSRYYDPGIGRFINADAFLYSGNEIVTTTRSTTLITQARGDF